MNSICIATFNGEKYIVEQLNSILNQINVLDEIIIVDDCSVDNTIKIIQSFKDRRIILYENSTNLGHVKAFEKAVNIAKGEFIFLSDQDDVWTDNRYHYLLCEIDKYNSTLLISNYKNFTSKISFSNEPYTDTNPIYLLNTFFKLIFGTGNYFGCTYIFNRKINSVLLPFPKFVYAHDLYILLVNLIFGKVVYSNFISVNRRLHSNNLTKRNSLIKRIKFRIKLFTQFLFLLKKYNEFK